MSLPLVLRPLARADSAHIHAELQAESAGLGDRFLDRLHKTLEGIEAMPEMHAPVWRIVRAVRIRKFRYVVYHVVLEARVEVPPIIHGSRDASEWRARVDADTPP